MVGQQHDRQHTTQGKQKSAPVGEGKSSTPVGFFTPKNLLIGAAVVGVLYYMFMR